MDLGKRVQKQRGSWGKKGGPLTCCSSLFLTLNILFTSRVANSRFFPARLWNFLTAILCPGHDVYDPEDIHVGPAIHLIPLYVFLHARLPRPEEVWVDLSWEVV